MRYLLAIAGLVATAIVASVVWILLPHPPQVPVGASVAQAQQAAAPAEIQAEDTDQGEFRVCNETPNKVSVAFGYRADKGWQSEGWWVADPTVCVTVYRGDLESRRYYYIYGADDISGGAWDGDVYMCTRDETFTHQRKRSHEEDSSVGDSACRRGRIRPHRLLLGARWYRFRSRGGDRQGLRR